MSLARRAAVAIGLAATLTAPAFAQGSRDVAADSIAVRFYAPDVGGAVRPHFVTKRQVSFEARLLALEEDPAGVVQPRHVRAAIEAHIAEDILEELPLEPPADPRAIEKTSGALRAATEQRVGGPPAIERAEKVEGFVPADFDAILRREARAAIYLDRAIAPFLTIDADELREKYRTTSHPFRRRPFEDVRTALANWLVMETFRGAEQSYLQTARSRITIVYF